MVQLMQHRHVCTLTGRVAYTNRFFDTPISVLWEVVIGAYSWIFEGDEDDEAAGTTAHHTFASPVFYEGRP